ncbi:class I SAM-dependent methyltransferase [Vibrio sp. S17_S38]|uniref:class I SAM-dependent methyltransferase n=1 Tax=Vibrio sp. S17_S38 TaxID=2720229 RepID=UPI0016806F5C|nr:class I SAM-dependent methyltransferase [Vibrio sp. S17_S38]MBD1574647.1 class I SAM-dependent methyltransferase [Vibrio sp. S17_S38]
MTDSVKKFDQDRAGEYAQQSRIALAGYDACHDLAACLLSAVLGADRKAQILVVGAGGTAQEIIAASKLAPNWRFTAVDPSAPMLQLSKDSLASKGLTHRVTTHLGYVKDLKIEEKFDAAILIGVIHHLKGENEKKDVLNEIASKLKPDAPLIIAGNRFPYASKPLFLSAWGELWRMNGVSKEDVEGKRAKILEGADPLKSNEAVIDLLAHAGFTEVDQFFSSLFWSAWIAKYTLSTSQRS